MNGSIFFNDFGTAPYRLILQKQTHLFQNIISRKKENGESLEEYLLMGEHFPVITVGRRGKENNVLADSLFLSENNIEVINIKRGGDVTYHCPGQLVVYPILDLEKHHIGVKDYVNLLEEIVIRVIGDYGIKGKRVEGATGVWIGDDANEERKICAIGVQCSRFCTMHGLALNVNADLSGFRLINPCGFVDKGVTSISRECGGDVYINEIKKKISDIFFSLVFPLQEVLDLPEEL